MKLLVRCVLAALVLVQVPLACHAQAVASVDGHIVPARFGTTDTSVIVPIAFRYVAAISIDNTEGMLLEPRAKIRMALTDRPVPIESLFGIGSLPVWYMGLRGEVRGVLIEFDPADRSRLVIQTLDSATVNEGSGPGSLSLNDTAGVWDKLVPGAHRISGTLRHMDDNDVAFSFDAPLIENPVTAQLTGTAARSSSFIAIMRARYLAFAQGNMTEAARLSTREAGARLQALSAQEVAAYKSNAPRGLALIDKVTRIVIRAKTAAALESGDFRTDFALEDGVWKISD